jgi:hypothetical protein
MVPQYLKQAIPTNIEGTLLKHEIQLPTTNPGLKTTKLTNHCQNHFFFLLPFPD